MADEDATAEGAAMMINVPKHAVSVFNVSFSPAEVILFASAMMPGLNSEGEVAMGVRPEVVLSMSPHAAAELTEVLRGLVENHENEFGPLRTPFLDERRKA